MADRLFVAVLGHRNSGKTHTWNELFGRTVRTGSSSRTLELRPGECVEVFLISGSNEERAQYAGDVLRDQKARVILCSMQYVDRVSATIGYILDQKFRTYVLWLNPAYSDASAYPDYLGIGNRLLYAGATVAVRSGKNDADSRVRELKEFIYGWAAFRRLVVHC